MSLRVQNGTPINVPNLVGSPSTGGGAAPSGPMPAGPMPAAAASVAASNSLGIPSVNQVLDNWCWAACAEMVLSAFGIAAEKCKVASFFFNKQCHHLVGSCDEGIGVADITGIYPNFYGIDVDFGYNTVRFATIQKQIDIAGLPVEVLITWGPGNGKHAIVIDGWRIKSDGSRYVKVKDPVYADGEIRFSDLFSNYTSDSGVWEGTWIRFRKVVP